jgi:GrpB-like predicted nucleotidyltransferase (UPF0157 family)
MPSCRINIVEYRTAWRLEYEVIETELRQILGTVAISVDHIGSTAVPALAAKDIIDIQVTVSNLDEGISEALTAAGYTTHTPPIRHDHLPPGFNACDQDWSKLFFMQKTGARRSNIHIRQIGQPNQRYPLLVRDFLRAEPQIAQAYAELKRRLAVSLAEADTYPDVKDPVADIIYFAAERWALATNWQLPTKASAREA